MKTTIFLSSTCFDLAILREALSKLITELGHHPLLSELSSFPVEPETSTLENCKSRIRKNTDVFVLIIGGKRGSIDLASNKSITNIEYEAAREIGIPILVFVNSDVWRILPIWEANPSADLTTYVDHADVFAFIKRIQKENRWIFSFSRLEDIKETLTNQLSFLLKTLLEQKLNGSLRPDEVFAGESDKTRNIVRQKPQFWEFLLTEELLRSRLKAVDRKFSELEQGLLFQKAQHIKPKELVDHAMSKTTDLMNLVTMMSAILSEIKTSWGPPGTPGDEKLILEAVNRLGDLCMQLFEWERDLLSLSCSDELKPLTLAMRGWTAVVYAEVKRIPDELSRIFGNNPAPSQSYHIQLKIAAPPMEEFMRELENLRLNHAHLFYHN